MKLNPVSQSFLLQIEKAGLELQMILIHCGVLQFNSFEISFSYSAGNHDSRENPPYTDIENVSPNHEQTVQLLIIAASVADKSKGVASYKETGEVSCIPLPVADVPRGNGGF